MIDSTSLPRKTPSETKHIVNGHYLSIYERQTTIAGHAVSREYIPLKPGCTVLPVSERGEILMIYEYMGGDDKMVWRFPAGKASSGTAHDLIECAQTELREEAGFRADHIELVRRGYLAPWVTEMFVGGLVAWGLHPDRADTGDEEYPLEARFFSPQDAYDLLNDPEHGDMSSLYHFLSVGVWQKEKGITLFDIPW